MEKPIKKKNKKHIINQNEFKERFIKNVNKQLKNGINVISYRELIGEGMSQETFWDVINQFTENGWKINIGEFDIEVI